MITEPGQNSLSKELNIAGMLNDSSIDRVMAIDTDWNLIAWNKTSETTTGYRKKDILGKNLLEVFPLLKTDDEILLAFREAFEGKKSFLPASNGFNRRYIENHYIPLHDEQRGIIGVMNIMHDVAHRIKVERQLLKLNTALEKKYEQLEKANNDLATFTYIAGRDLQEPIKHVYTSLELMARKEGGTLSNTSRGNLRKMQASLNRMNLLLDDILAVSKVSNYKLQAETVDLNAVLQSVQESMADKLNSKNVVIDASPLPSVNGSAEMLGYLFHHVIDNAIKFQPPNQDPVITIFSQPVVLDGAEAGGDEFVEISFADNGIGFDAADSERIFNMFERLRPTEFKGSGIGLAICKKIIDAHDGLIIADSQPGHGSTIKCYLQTAE